MGGLENLDLNLCITFLTVAKAGSISRAANMLYVSQPAVSYSMKILEERLISIIIAARKNEHKKRIRGIYEAKLTR